MMFSSTSRRACAVAVLLAFALAGCGRSRAPSVNTMLDRALAAHVAGRLDEAEKGYQAILAKDPRNKYAYYNLGVLAQGRGNDTEAESDFRLAISIDPRYVPAIFNLAIIRAKVHANKEAEQLYRSIIEIEPNHAGAHKNLGFLLLAMGRTKEGKAEIAVGQRLSSPTPTPAQTETPGQEPASPPPGG